MSIKVLNIDSTGKSENLNLSEKLIGLKVNNKLLKYVVDWQLNRSKKRVAKTKQRNEVTGSTRKIYAQKGTGGARHSSRKAPIFVGGGVAHGPKGDNYKTKSINKKIRKLALAQTISKKNNNKELYILDDVKKKITKTKIFNNFLIKNKLENVLIISDQETEKNIYKSVRNIPDVKLINYKGTNVYDLIRFKNVLFTKSSIKNIEQRLTNEKINYLDTIKSPVITEKATGLSELNKVVFKVHEGASKQSIKKNIEKIFKVNVIKINTIKNKPKIKIVRGNLEKKVDLKKQ